MILCLPRVRVREVHLTEGGIVECGRAMSFLLKEDDANARNLVLKSCGTE